MYSMEQLRGNGCPISLLKVKHIILVLSGKGGVGKSSISTQLALTLTNLGFKVGLLDIDLTGPSLPRMFNLENKSVFQSSEGWNPVKVPTNSGNDNNLLLMSIGFLLNDRGNSVIWKGPKKASMIRQFIEDVHWGELDYLIIDTPPGTSDEHISIAEQLRWANPDGAIIVTTPQKVSIMDVKKEINFCKTVNLKILGIIENMSGFICPHCESCTNIFSSGGGKELAQQYNLKYLGNIPIDPKFVELIENQSSLNGYLVDLYKNTSLSPIFNVIVNTLLQQNIPPRY